MADGQSQSAVNPRLSARSAASVPLGRTERALTSLFEPAALPAPFLVDRRRELQRLARLGIRMSCDVVAAAVGLAMFDWLAGRVGPIQMAWAAGYVALAVAIDASHVHREWTYLEELVLAIKVASVALVLTATGGFLLGLPVSRILFGSVTLVMILGRPGAAWLFELMFPAPRVRHDLLLACNDDECDTVAAALAEARVRRHRVVGRVSKPADDSTAGDQVERLLEACEQSRPTRVVLGAAHLADPAFAEAVNAVNERGISIRPFWRFFEDEYGRVPLSAIGASWFLFDIGPLHNYRYRIARRGVDLLAGAAAAVVLGALFPFLALAVKCSSPGPVFYRQVRVGQRGRHFTIVKLRTMTVNAEEAGPQFAGKHDARVTKVGRFLRQTRLDELPQCVNLLRGEMSLIGPRPERPEFVERFEQNIPFYSKRLLIKPGLTGWAQVHEGYGTTLEDTIRKLERDLYYLKHQSLSLDLRIMAATLSSILRFAGQ